MPGPHSAPSAGELIRLGFSDLSRTRGLLNEPAVSELFESADIVAFADAADPDIALLGLSNIVAQDEAKPLVDALSQDAQSLQRLLTVLGVSNAMAEYLTRHPTRWLSISPDLEPDAPQRYRALLLQSVGADPQARAPVAAGSAEEQLADLRIAYRQELLQIVNDDINHGVSVERTAQTLALLADAVLEAALAIARHSVGPEAQDCRFSVIALGKCGALELNYISDVDVVFVVESDSEDDTAAIRVGTKLATALMRACMASTPEGTIWEVDPALRPEGKSGALVRTLQSYIGYYERWAETWEFQAQLKARAAAGDLELGQRYVETMQAFVWGAAGRENFVEDVQAMRRRVERSISGKKADRELKLAPGGLRDVEFSVQLLQLVHGRHDEKLRTAPTFAALRELANQGYIGLQDADELASAYDFLRTLEHRVQVYKLKRTHTLPSDDTNLRRIARSMGMRIDPVAELEKQWRNHARDARRLHEKLFYRPLLNAVARLGAGEAKLSPAAAGQRLLALGFTDPDSALRHLEALTSGISRRAAIQRTLLPVMLEWFSRSPDPDAALLNFRKVSEELGLTPWYLRLLRDQSAVAERLADLLGSSQYATGLLMHDPQAVGILADTYELEPRSRMSLEAEALTIVDRHDSPTTAVSAVRGLRRRELFRISAANVLRLADAEEVAQGLSDVASATLAGALHASVKSVTGQYEEDRGVRFLVVAMGRLGGAELGYSSDADVLFVYEPTGVLSDSESAQQAQKIASEIRRLLTLPGPDPILEVDTSLRPEGRNGPIVRSLDSYRAYYEKWASGWEAQALLRAVPACGDHQMARAFTEMIDPLRYPEGGITHDHLIEIRRLKARMESERLPRGVDPRSHVKMGPGGLSDVEWTAQLLQLQHGYNIPGLRTAPTFPALRAARDADLIAGEDAEMLMEAWLFATRIRNANMLVTGRADDVFPGRTKRLAGVAHLLGYDEGESQVLVEDYRKAARHARAVVDRVFYGFE